MTDLNYFKAAVLGLVQGLTEFLPVSSSAHLALVQRWFELAPQSQTVLFFDLAMHLGTLASMVVIFARPMWRFLGRLVREVSVGWGDRPRAGWRIVALGVVATVPTGVLGLAFKEEFEAAFGRPRWIGVELMVTGALLIAASRVTRGRGRWRDFRMWQAFLVGVAQAVAILPGISRSGSTICTALFFGLRRQWATQFSFLLAFPAILGAAAVSFKDVFEESGGSLGHLPWGAIVVGTLVAAVSGAAALALLIQMVRRAKLHYFSAYCLLLGLLIALGWV